MPRRRPARIRSTRSKAGAGRMPLPARRTCAVRARLAAAMTSLAMPMLQSKSPTLVAGTPAAASTTGTGSGRSGQRQRQPNPPAEPHPAAGDPEDRQEREPGAGGSQRQPLRLRADRPGQRKLGPPLGIEHAPEAAHRPLQPALPWLVDALHEVDGEAVALCHHQHLADEAGLIDGAGQGLLAHPPPARPADLADEDGLAGEGQAHGRHDLANVTHGRLDGHGPVLPVGEDVDGEDVDGVRDLGVLQPELPDVGVTHRHLDRRGDPQDLLDQPVRRHLPAQQHLVADDHAPDRLRAAIGQSDHGGNLLGVALEIASQPSPEKNLEAKPFGNGRHLLQSLIDGVDANAAGQPGKGAKIGLDLLGRDDQCLVERRLAVAERRIGDAREARGGSIDDRERAASPGPEAKAEEEGRERRPERRQRRAACGLASGTGYSQCAMMAESSARMPTAISNSGHFSSRNCSMRGFLSVLQQQRSGDPAEFSRTAPRQYEPGIEEAPHEAT